MPTFELQSPDGKGYEVDAPDMASAYHALNGGAPPPDKYQMAAQKESDAVKASGAPTPSPMARRVLQGATFNSADEILAGLQTPLEMIRQGTFNPAEAYRYAKAREDLILNQDRQSTGTLGTLAEVGGGLASGAGLARAGVGLTGRLAPNAGLFARSTAGAADAAGFGTVAGGMEGNSLAERGHNAAVGGLTGAAIGGLLPGAAALGSTALSPVLSNFSARFNPAGFAQNQVARGLQESNLTPQTVAGHVAQAAREGQPEFTLADAMGNSGQRMLSTVTGAPGAGRTEAVDFLNARQAGQGRRVANTLAEGFNAPETAAQTSARLTAERGTAANVNYGDARASAGAVDVTPAIQQIDRTLSPGISRFASPQSNIADTSIEGTLRRARALLTDGRSQVSDFQSAFSVKQEIDHMIETSSPTLQRVLIPVRNALDTQLEAASPQYANARATFAAQSRPIEAVDTGRTAALRGRTENTIPAFRGMSAPEQAAFRSGYVDPLIEQTQGAAVGANKARPFTSDAFQNEAAAMAPMTRGATMMNRIGRENTMFETRAQAMGGSRTAENLADAGAMGIDPTLVGHILHGNWAGAARSLLSAGANALSGNTAAVRQEVGRLLLMRGANVSAPQLQTILQTATRLVQQRQALARNVTSGLFGGAAVAPSATGMRQ